MPCPLKLIKATEHIVAVDVGHTKVIAVARDQDSGRVGQPGGVESSGVYNEPNTTRHKIFQGRYEMVQKRGGVTLVAVLGARLAEDQHRDLGEVVASEDVDAAGSGHVGHGRSAVTVEAGAVADADGTLPASWC